MHEVPNWAAQENSLLTIEPMGLPPYSVRGVRQTLEPMPAELHRTVNGRLVNFTPVQFRLFRSTISCRDQDVPAISGVWPGDVMTVSCVHPLRFRADSDAVPIRSYVEGSLHEVDGYVYYRPVLQMMFIGWTSDIAEWDAEIAWAFDLEELVVPDEVSA